MDRNRLPAFTRFISDLRDLWAELPDDESRMNKARGLLEALLADPEIKAHSRQWPSTEGRRNLMFYEDPDYGFVINGVVREPGRVGGIHDHAQAWVLYGLLVGFGYGHRVTLAPLALVWDQAMAQGQQVFIIGYPLGHLYPADFRFTMQVVEVHLVLAVILAGHR